MVVTLGNTSKNAEPHFVKSVVATNGLLSTCNVAREPTKYAVRPGQFTKFLQK